MNRRSATAPSITRAGARRAPARASMMLLVIEPHDRHQQWLGVADIMKAEAHEAANQKLDEFAGARQRRRRHHARARRSAKATTSEQILKLIDEDEDIAILVLAAGTGKEGPGPLVAGLGKVGGQLSDPGRDRAGASGRRGPRRPVVAAVAIDLVGRKGPSIGVIETGSAEHGARSRQPCSSRPKPRPIRRP